MVFKDIIDGKVIINLICTNFIKIKKYNYSKQHYNHIQTLSKHYYLLFVDLAVSYKLANSCFRTFLLTSKVHIICKAER